MGLNIIFAGTPEFAKKALEKLLASSHQIIAVYTQPDRPSGRGLKLKASPVKELALKHNIPIHQPASLKGTLETENISNYKADVMVVAAYGLLIPTNILHLPRLGCINIHPSLLPRWRGAAPIQRTIHAGDKKTGVAIMQMDEGLDTGAIYLVKEYTLTSDETTQSLHDRLADLGADALIETLDLLEQQNIKAIPQETEHVTYAHKISKEEALIDWQQSANEIDQLIRAFNPWPVAYTSWQGKNLRIWQAEKLEEITKATPRTILRASKEGIDIACGAGVLRLLQMQLPGGKVLSVHDFYNAHKDQLNPGQHLL